MGAPQNRYTGCRYFLTSNVSKALSTGKGDQCLELSATTIHIACALRTRGRSEQNAGLRNVQESYDGVSFFQRQTCQSCWNGADGQMNGLQKSDPLHLHSLLCDHCIIQAGQNLIIKPELASSLLAAKRCLETIQRIHTQILGYVLPKTQIPRTGADSSAEQKCMAFAYG